MKEHTVHENIAANIDTWQFSLQKKIRTGQYGLAYSVNEGEGAPSDLDVYVPGLPPMGLQTMKKFSIRLQEGSINLGPHNNTVSSFLLDELRDPTSIYATRQWNMQEEDLKQVQTKQDLFMAYIVDSVLYQFGEVHPEFARSIETVRETGRYGWPKAQELFQGSNLPQLVKNTLSHPIYPNAKFSSIGGTIVVCRYVNRDRAEVRYSSDIEIFTSTRPMTAEIRENMLYMVDESNDPLSMGHTHVTKIKYSGSTRPTVYDIQTHSPWICMPVAEPGINVSVMQADASLASAFRPFESPWQTVYDPSFPISQ